MTVPIELMILFFYIYPSKYKDGFRFLYRHDTYQQPYLSNYIKLTKKVLFWHM